MTIQEAIDLIGKQIYVYAIYSDGYEVYEPKIIMIGEDFVYDDNIEFRETYRTHYFTEYNKTWFIDKDLCEKKARNEFMEN